MMLSGDIPSNQTIYIKNLNEKIKKEELKRSHYSLFSQYGRILDVVALKTSKLRGQAWIFLGELTAASNAFRQMQNFPFYDKPMVHPSSVDNYLRLDIADTIGILLKRREATFQEKRRRSKKKKLLFAQYPGFKEVRMIEAKPGIAFVEYEDEEQSGVAMQAVQGFKIAPQFAMAISFAKK